MSSTAALALLGTATLGAAANLAVGIATPDTVALIGVGAIGALVAAWYALSALVLLAARAGSGRGALRWCARWGAPGMRRLAILALTASATLSSTVAAQATEVPLDLGWGAPAPIAVEHSRDPTPPPGSEGMLAPPAPAAAPAVEPRSTPETASMSAPTVHVVHPGDSLWTIARDHLPTGATDAQIDSAWRDWYAANHPRIGPDADVVHPGQPLTAPAGLDRAD